MKFPTLFINHGGGPLPLMGRQPNLVQHMKDVVANLLPKGQIPKAIIVVSAHWEANPIEISSSPNPSMLYDYHGFPKETYEYKYPAPGSPDLAKNIQTAFSEEGIVSKLNPNRGFDHGVFVPLMLMYPDDMPAVVCVSLHGSLEAEKNIAIGRALRSIRERNNDILILGSGFTFHNMRAFFNPTDGTVQASDEFNTWLKDTLMNDGSSFDENLNALAQWETLGPGARICHPREEHLLPLLVIAAAAGSDCKPQVIYDTTSDGTCSTGGSSTDHAVTGYMFQ